MNEELKQCPFCGGSDIHPVVLLDGRKCVLCGTCDSVTGAYRSEDRAMRIWNRRPIEGAQAARIAELEVEKAKLARKCVIFQTLMENIMGTAIIETEEYGDETAGAALSAIRGAIYDTYHELEQEDLR